MKYFDVVNEHDEVVGSATSVECHSNPSLIHRVVHFTLIDQLNKKILISQRSPNVKFDRGMWCFMGEHVLKGDEYQDALLRGLKDELGFGGNFEIRDCGHAIFHQEKQTELARFFVAFYKEGNITPNQAEILSVEWINIQDLRKNVLEYSTMTQYWIDKVNWVELLN